MGVGTWIRAARGEGRRFSLGEETVQVSSGAALPPLPLCKKEGTRVHLSLQPGPQGPFLQLEREEALRTLLCRNYKVPLELQFRLLLRCLSVSLSRFLFFFFFF